MTIANVESGEVFLGAFDFAAFTGKAEFIWVGCTFGFSNEVEDNVSSVAVARDAPVGIVVANHLREVKPEGGWEFEVEEYFFVIT